MITSIFAGSGTTLNSTCFTGSFFPPLFPAVLVSAGFFNAEARGGVDERGTLVEGEEERGRGTEDDDFVSEEILVDSSLLEISSVLRAGFFFLFFFFFSGAAGLVSINDLFNHILAHMIT